MNIHESYVSLETAKLLKKAGFDWDCDFCFQGKKRIPIYNIVSGDSDYYDSPSISVAQRWLREEKGIEVSTEMDDNQNDCRNCEWYCLYKINKNEFHQ